MKTIIESSISKEIDSGFLEYSMYVLEQRAIPSAIDGFKNVHRKLVYSMINEYSGKKVKLADLSGISNLNYHHGESSAASAAVTLTADWNNNCPVFTGQGNFGSRLVQEASAPRYIKASLSKEFKTFFIDEEVCEPSFDIENPEPRFYLPTIPWVLVNGISGIAVGFATNILPRSIADIVSNVKLCLKNRSKFLADNKSIRPTFPQFSGDIVQTDINQWVTSGKIEYVGKYTYNITELPIGYDRATYVTLLNDMCDKELIKDYTDECSENGFGFLVKTTGAQKEKIDKDTLKYFKLQKSMTENLTTLGIDGKLKIFSNVSELIVYFCDYRLTKFKDKIDYDKTKLKNEISYLDDKGKFINEVVDNKINFRKSSKDDLLTYISEYVTKADHGKKFVNIPLHECTRDSLKTLSEKIEALKEELKIVEKLEPIEVFGSKIKGLK